MLQNRYSCGHTLFWLSISAITLYLTQWEEKKGSPFPKCYSKILIQRLVNPLCFWKVFPSFAFAEVVTLWRLFSQNSNGYVDNWGCYECGSGGVWEIPVPSSQLCCEPNSGLQKNLQILLMVTMFLLAISRKFVIDVQFASPLKGDTFQPLPSPNTSFALNLSGLATSLYLGWIWHLFKN